MSNKIEKDYSPLHPGSKWLVNMYKIPTKDFDALAATDEQLMEYGILPRPDKTQNPVWYKTWYNHFVLNSNRIIPEFKEREPKVRNKGNVEKETAHKNIAKPRTSSVTANNTPSFNDYFLTSNWSGYVLDMNNPQFILSGSIQLIYGSWTVPVPQIPQGASIPNPPVFASCAWIGFDNNFFSPTPKNSLDLIQMGTEHDITYSNPQQPPNYYAWFQWGSSGQTVLSIANGFPNFPVNATDQIECLMYMISPVNAYFSIKNVTTGLSMIFGIIAPPNSTELPVSGYCAEWILENPIPIGLSVPGTLANYTIILFTDCFAIFNKPGLPRTREVIGACQGTNLTTSYQTIMTSDTGNVNDQSSYISYPTAVDFDTFVVTYGQPSPQWQIT